MADIATAFVKIMPSAQGIKEQLGRQFEGEGKSSGKSFGKGFGGLLKKVLTGAAVAKSLKAFGSIVRQGVDAYANYEQLVGGVETLFGTGGQGLREYAASIGKSVADAAGEWKAYKAAQNTVLQNASNAYATAGLSANAYMETVTGFAASLKQSFDGTAAGAQAAAIAADMAVTDIADNANKMGTPMQRITDAYQGFAKQNYTMLDNLKLGYGGTKTEMERLLADAQKLTGVKYDINNLADVYSAIHVIQGELGITGTTAKEAMSTIQGSLSMTKAAWENVLTALGGGGELDGAVTNLIISAAAFAGNLLPVINTVLAGIVSALPQLVTAAVGFVPELATTLITLAPTLLTAGIQLFTGLVQALPMIVPALVAALPGMITQVTTALVTNLPLLIGAGIQLFLGLAQALPQVIPAVVSAITSAIPDMAGAILEGIPAMLSAGIDLINGLADGIWQGIQSLLSSVGEWCGQIIAKVKGVFGIASPSKVFREFGKYLDEGLALGITGSTSIVQRAVGELAGKTTDGFAAVGELRSGIGTPMGAVSPVKQNIVNLNVSAKELTKSDTDYLVETVNRRLGGFA